ncbi:DNA-binding transcriptional LysR family regulator [Tamaricihabitans halophyticus]|uniref:DNA-binding transcriptional LysR family regulator n=1 Tax=Tamaricihabitans halophyticus TaxID=1262583 RepID=A0A4R2R6P1_9PSEU|nr:LysR substrate-binding domain-containing protein [Tamaricihabitans halophyticus]TCP57528.1 DNA-binding transcriptional LysR family regulator [Tamaricihabitans halophyticus]
MELQQIRYVIAVAETGNFTRAAERCYVVQSALSHQIAALERELGTKLFARTSRRVELTAAGQAFLPAARACLEAADRSVTEAAAAAGHVRGHLRVGMIPTVTALDVPALLREFHQQYPQVRIALRVGRSDEMVAAIRSGEIDLAVLGLPESDPPRAVRCRELRRDRHAAIVDADHRLAGSEAVTLQDLAHETFADFPAGTPGRAQSDLAFTRSGLSREVTFEVMDADLLLDLVRNRLAITLLPSAMAIEDPELVTIPLAEGPTRIEYLAWSDFNPTPATTAFLDLLDIDQNGKQLTRGDGSAHPAM